MKFFLYMIPWLIVHLLACAEEVNIIDRMGKTSSPDITCKMLEDLGDNTKLYGVTIPKDFAREVTIGLRNELDKVLFFGSLQQFESESPIDAKRRELRIIIRDELLKNSQINIITDSKIYRLSLLLPEDRIRPAEQAAPSNR